MVSITQDMKYRLCLFEKALAEKGINHKLIRPFTPRHNSKVERSHRKDNEYFYAIAKFYSFNDFKLQLKKHNARYNNFSYAPFGLSFTKRNSIQFLNDGVTYV